MVTHILLAVLTTVLWGSAISATTIDVPQATASDSLVTSMGREFVEAVNSNSAEFRNDVVHRIYSSEMLTQSGEERLVGIFEKIRNQYGVLDYHHSEKVMSSLHLYARSVTDNQWHDFQFRMEEESPSKLMQLVFIAEVAEPVYLPNSSIESSFTKKWLDNYIDKLENDNDLAAAVLVEKGDTVIFERYAGYADRGRNRRIGPATKFNLGSGNKMFTALSIMQLRDAGKLSLSDTLERYFPEITNREFTRSTTVAHLLSHTSGLGDYWDDNYERSWDSITSVRQVLPFVHFDSLPFTPGAGFQYSNAGFILAGLIIERVTGESYYRYVHDHICDVLGMTETDSYEIDGKDTSEAQELTRSDSGWVETRHGRRGTSAGGGFSTGRDMLRFARGLREGRLLDTQSVREMLVVRNREFDDKFPYGYGLEIGLRSGELVSYGHGGIAPGVNFEFKYYPNDDITFVIFCNQDNGAYDDLRKNIEKLITGDR